MTQPILETVDLSRSFGALAAVDAVTLAFTRQQIHCVIGPNGAGKTTLLNLLSGDLRPSAGTVRCRGRTISGLPPHRVARAGIGRSYQRTNVFPPLSCLANCRLAAQTRFPSSLRFFRAAAGYAEVSEAALDALDTVGIAQRAATPAVELSHGEQRQLEIAVLLAARPEILPLDEPLAGMGPEESVRMVELLRRLGREHTLILIEHDMDAVFALADTLTVLVQGRVLASGAPDAIRSNPAVQDAYLGAAPARP